MADQLTGGYIDGLHNESERLIKENGGLYKYSKLAGQIAAESISTIITGWSHQLGHQGTRDGW